MLRLLIFWIDFSLSAQTTDRKRQSKFHSRADHWSSTIWIDPWQQVQRGRVIEPEAFFFEFLISRTVQISSKPHWDEVVRTFCHFCFCLQQETISWNHRDCWCNSYRGDNNRRIPNNWRLPGRLLHNWNSLRVSGSILEYLILTGLVGTPNITLCSLFLCWLVQTLGSSWSGHFRTSVTVLTSVINFAKCLFRLTS